MYLQLNELLKLTVLNEEAGVVCFVLQRCAALHHDHSPSAVERSCTVFLVKQRPLSHSGGKTEMMLQLLLKMT